MFDGVLIVDGLNLPGLAPDRSSTEIEYGVLMMLLDPMLVLAQMARVTRHLGLSGTISTLVTPPYQIARQLASLDHLSDGRAGWNIVTGGSPAVADNYGLRNLPTTQERYDHADEVVEACLALWGTWDEDALELNRETGRFADPAKVHYVRYEGKQVKLRGGLVTPRSPQGHPVFLQAGGSPRGRQFAARWAEAIFTIRNDKEGAQAFYSEIRTELDAAGRKPDSCVVLPAIEVFVDKTEALAQEQAAYLDSLAINRAGLSVLSAIFGRDVTSDALETPISRVRLCPAGAPVVGTYDNMLRVTVEGREATLGEIAHLQATTHLSPRFVGTPESIADEMQDRFETGCCDGFIVTHALSPGSLSRFVELVVPELQRRGLLRTQYSGQTFRENLQS
jgi:FMN-dependent oxidoreductase (nitrilotriacetate monooxygenase family)